MTTKQLSFNKQNLFPFNAEARMKDKRDYSKSALIQFRHGIERYLNNPLFKGAINIEILQTLCLHGPSRCLTYKPPLEKEDLAKLKTSAIF